MPNSRWKSTIRVKTIPQSVCNLRGIEIPEASGGLTGKPRDATMHMPQDKISVAALFALVKRFDKDFAPKAASEVVNKDGIAEGDVSGNG